MAASLSGDSVLNERATLVLKSLIETHINDGLPIGSKTLAKVSGLDVSAATIRNIMSDLEEAGYIQSPHTSAGRIPTQAGYRLFIDSLLQVESINQRTVDQYREQLGHASTPQGLVQSASNMIAGITQLAGIVTLPRQDGVVLHQVEFLKLSDRRVLAVLVMSNGDVQNRVLRLEREYERSELEQVANYLTENFAGSELMRAREKLASELKVLKEDMNSLMESVLELGEKALNTEETVDDAGFVLAGETRLMDYDELSDVQKLRQLFDAFNQKGDILHVLDQCLSARSLQIYIGNESGNEALGDCSLVTAPYTADGQIVGVLGVIGPTRMAYDRVIPMVDVTARLLGAALNSR